MTIDTDNVAVTLSRVELVAIAKALLAQWDTAVDAEMDARIQEAFASTDAFVAGILCVEVSQLDVIRNLLAKIDAAWRVWLVDDVIPSLKTAIDNLDCAGLDGTVFDVQCALRTAEAALTALDALDEGQQSGGAD